MTPEELEAFEATQNIFNSMSKGVDPIVETKAILPDGAPDLSKIKLPDNFTNMIMESSFNEVSPKKVIKETKQVSINETVNKLMTEFNTLLTRAKQVIDELTSCGMIGTNTAPKKNQRYLNKNIIKKIKNP